MKLTIWGAAQQVTGSMHLLEVDGYKILIDCGLNYENGTELSDNDNFPFLPHEINVVIVTHAHIDHSGNIPTLIKQGFQGQIICTAATADLMQLLLTDSVSIFLRQQNKKPFKRGKFKSQKFIVKQPLYLQKHVEETKDRIITIGINKEFTINEQIKIEIFPTGHLLGAVAVVFSINENGATKKIAFSGDVGRKNYPVLRDPVLLPELDYLVCESTYGGRNHSKENTINQLLIDIVNDACIKQPGRLIIPAFSVGRTQALVYSLNKIFSNKLLPNIPVFVDSPMATLATEVFRKHRNFVSEDAQKFYENMGDEFEFENLNYVKDLSESKQISNYFEPCIIISSAGMLEGGRIQDHLYHNIQNFYATILFIGFCAKGTLGNRLLRGDSIVNIKGRELSVYATIKQTDLLSGHADHDDLIQYITHNSSDTLKKVYLIHGELDSMYALKDDLEKKNYKVHIPGKGETIEL